MSQGDLPSPSDRRFYSRLLSADDTEDMVDAEEYLLPYKGTGNHDNHACNATVHTHTFLSEMLCLACSHPDLTLDQRDLSYRLKLFFLSCVSEVNVSLSLSSSERSSSQREQHRSEIHH